MSLWVTHAGLVASPAVTGKVFSLSRVLEGSRPIVFMRYSDVM